MGDNPKEETFTFELPALVKFEGEYVPVTLSLTISAADRYDARHIAAAILSGFLPDEDKLHD